MGNMDVVARRLSILKNYCIYVLEAYLRESFSNDEVDVNAVIGTSPTWAIGPNITDSTTAQLDLRVNVTFSYQPTPTSRDLEDESCILFETGKMDTAILELLRKSSDDQILEDVQSVRLRFKNESICWRENLSNRPSTSPSQELKVRLKMIPSKQPTERPTMAPTPEKNATDVHTSNIKKPKEERGLNLATLVVGIVVFLFLLGTYVSFLRRRKRRRGNRLRDSGIEDHDGKSTDSIPSNLIEADMEKAAKLKINGVPGPILLPISGLREKIVKIVRNGKGGVDNPEESPRQGSSTYSPNYSDKKLHFASSSDAGLQQNAQEREVGDIERDKRTADTPHKSSKPIYFSSKTLAGLHRPQHHSFGLSGYYPFETPTTTPTVPSVDQPPAVVSASPKGTDDDGPIIGDTALPPTSPCTRRRISPTFGRRPHRRDGSFEDAIFSGAIEVGLPSPMGCFPVKIDGGRQRSLSSGDVVVPKPVKLSPVSSDERSDRFFGEYEGLGLDHGLENVRSSTPWPYKYADGEHPLFSEKNTRHNTYHFNRPERMGSDGDVQVNSPSCKNFNHARQLSDHFERVAGASLMADDFDGSFPHGPVARHDNNEGRSSIGPSLERQVHTNSRRDDVRPTHNRTNSCCSRKGNKMTMEEFHQDWEEVPFDWEPLDVTALGRQTAPPIDVIDDELSLRFDFAPDDSIIQQQIQEGLKGQDGDDGGFFPQPTNASSTPATNPPRPPLRFHMSDVFPTPALSFSRRSGAIVDGYLSEHSATSSALHPNDWSNYEGSTDDGSIHRHDHHRPMVHMRGHNQPTFSRRFGLRHTGICGPDFSVGASTHSGSVHTNGSKLINELIWLEDKIAAHKQNAVTTSAKGGGVADTPRRQPPKIPLGGIRGGGDGGEPLRPQIVCRDIVAPPGTLHVVVKNSAEGPSVHVVGLESSLGGKLFPGDLIIAVNGMDVRSMDATDVTALIGSEGEKDRRITIVRNQLL
eukprot:CAMPEP_0113300106 /NCGR_PEP_ID=MMETSP0010_2-20120614/1870_1 /TAXON_ID=216773 ORGANISM="Corethron hystrix, Strain 308" /NCGR_SAMPLE_ID=MMETSP0010_2 /ASSEMBLY_ACC=CAM_ASM_000155 /LENGTH=976 /DNA_ID=CAMNT_0000153467 /DNA_START=426 /DNA_END=3356 /DNA_ORIENTATION=+ /assembly_acc=CAM_ASM_000155